MSGEIYVERSYYSLVKKMIIENRRWVAGDEEFLKENYSILTHVALAKKLNRTVSSIATRARVLGLKKYRSLKSVHNKIELLAKADYTIPEISEKLELDYSNLWRYIRDNKIPVVCGRTFDNKKALNDGFEEDPLESVDYDQITFIQWYKRWYNTYRKGDIKEATKQKYRGVYTRLKDQPLGAKCLIKITREDVQSYVNWYGADRSKQTVLDHMQLIRSCFKDAVLDGHIKQNPATNVKPIYKELKMSVLELKNLREQKKWLESDEYQKTRYYLVFSLQQTLQQEPIVAYNANMQSAHQILDMIIFVALKTGARLAEVLGLTKNDVLSDSSELNIDKTWDYKHEEDGTFSQTKNTASIRKVMVDRETIDLLDKYIMWLENHRIETDSNTLFILKDSRIFGSTINTHLKRMLTDLGIEPITMHKLRHTQASYLIAKGVPLQVVAKRLGHTDTNMIQRVYGHLLRETEQMGNKMILELI